MSGYVFGAVYFEDGGERGLELGWRHARRLPVQVERGEGAFEPYPVLFQPPRQRGGELRRGCSRVAHRDGRRRRGQALRLARAEGRGISA